MRMNIPMNLVIQIAIGFRRGNMFCTVKTKVLLPCPMATSEPAYLVQCVVHPIRQPHRNSEARRGRDEGKREEGEIDHEMGLSSNLSASRSEVKIHTNSPRNDEIKTTTEDVIQRFPVFMNHTLSHFITLLPKTIVLLG